MQDAGQHFYRRGLARAIRTDKAKQLTRFHLERKPAHRFDGTILRLEQRADRTPHSRGFALGLKSLLQIGDFDGGHKDILVEHIKSVHVIAYHLVK
jgi:hypothetical protein